MSKQPSSNFEKIVAAVVGRDRPGQTKVSYFASCTTAVCRRQASTFSQVVCMHVTTSKRSRFSHKCFTLLQYMARVKFLNYFPATLLSTFINFILYRNFQNQLTYTNPAVTVLKQLNRITLVQLWGMSYVNKLLYFSFLYVATKFCGRISTSLVKT